MPSKIRDSLYFILFYFFLVCEDEEVKEEEEEEERYSISTFLSFDFLGFWRRRRRR